MRLEARGRQKLTAKPAFSPAAWGFLPIALGMAFLLIALIEGKKKAGEGEDA